MATGNTEIKVKVTYEANGVEDPKYKGQSQDEFSAADAASGGNGDSPQTIKGKGWKSGVKKGMAVVTMAGIATQFVFAQASRDISRYYMLEEDYKGNQNGEAAKTILNDIASVGGTALAGGVAGFQVGGIYGAIAGAIGGTVSGIINVSNSKSRAYLDAAYSINEANYQNYFRGTRAGLVGGSQNTEN